MKLRVWVWAVWAALAGAQEPEPMFKAEVRLVEVYATVLDQRGRYVDGLTKEQFEVRDNGALQPVLAFEAEQADLSCAILLDTTGSMARALPAVRNAIFKLIEEFRPNDAVAVYSFSSSLHRLQEYTIDKEAARRAVLRTRAAGQTALFDSLSQLARELAKRSGKKAVVLFTDGRDNSSALSAAAATARAKKVGVPVYAVAQGEALENRALMRQLEDIAQRTSGRCYRIRKSPHIREVFDDISAELKHTYMLAYKAPRPADQAWRAIEVAVKGPMKCKIRAREGYIPE